jgi:hypothetical protein
MLIILGGPDRVGKSTLATRLSQLSGFKVKHHNAPDLRDQSIFDVYRRNLAEGGDQIWDRSYLCAFILERYRKRNHDHLVEIMDLEFELSKTHEVIHVGVTKPWHWSAPLHWEELNKKQHPVSNWALRDAFIARQNEHHFYTTEMENFYRYVTMFPSFMVEPQWESQDVWSNIKAIANSERPRFTTSGAALH